MTANNNSLNHDIINNLFKTSTCLTYNPLEPTPAWLYGKELQQEYNRQHSIKFSFIRSKTAKMMQHNYNPDFHYFSDGTLIHNCGPQNFNDNKLNQKFLQQLDKIMTVLKIRNWPVEKIYAPQQQIDHITYTEFLRYISEQALIKHSYKEDLYIEPLPDKKTFVTQCFANGNSLITTSKNTSFPEDIRKIMALFADGQYYIIDGCNRNKILQIQNDYLQDYCRTDADVIPQEYLNILYEIKNQNE